MNFLISKERCLRLADLGEDCTVSAGIPLPPGEADSGGTTVRGIAFGRFVEMKRRELGLSAEQLAERAGITTGEAVSMEQDARYEAEASAVIRLADAFRVPHRSLLQLAGLIPPGSERFVRETTRFAARAEPTARLTDTERQLLEHYSAVLAEDS